MTRARTTHGYSPRRSRSLSSVLLRTYKLLTAESSKDVNTSGVLPKVRIHYLAVLRLLTVILVENEAHCDFKKLRSLLIRTHMLDLISTTEESHYENYRQQQMETRKFGEPKVKKLDNPKFKEEEEALRKRFTEQVKSEEARFRQWEQHVSYPSCNTCPTNVGSFFSLSPSVTASTKTLKWHTVPSSSWRPSWTIFRLDIIVVQAGGELVGCRR